MPATIYANHKYIVVLLLLICCCSCNNNDKNDTLFKAMDEGLTNSNTQLDNTTKQIFLALKHRIEDPEYKAKAELAVPKAILILELSNATVNYIEELKKAIAGKSKKELHDFFFNKKKGSELYDTLKAFKEKTQTIDTLMNIELEDAYNITSLDFEKTKNTNFTQYFFDNNSVTVSLALLTKFQNNIKTIEVNTLHYYFNKTNKEVSFCGFSHAPYPLAIANNTHVKAGEKIEVTAGIGDFFTKIEKTITIDGTKANEDQWGISFATITASKILGKHSIPVTIEFTKPDGVKATITKNIIYYVDSCR